MLNNDDIKSVYNKLIRDRIPEIIESKGKICVCETLSEDEFIGFLNEKLLEETDEYQKSGATEELADILEVIYAILDYNKITMDELQLIRLDKLEKRGGFEKRLLLKEVIER